MSQQVFQSCIDACYACASACEHCASEDLKETEVKKMVNCINSNRECAAICINTAHDLSMGGLFSKEICALCAKICHACAEECEKHKHMEHCKACAEACQKCAIACNAMAI